MAKNRRKRKKKDAAPAPKPGGWHTSVFAPTTPEADVWKMLPAWLAVAFVLRAIIALGGDFVLHPDEIMQYLEPAHRVVFGNGVVYWEFEYGARSWLVPGLVAAVLWSLDKIGLGEPWIYVYVVKLVFCLISLLVPWGCYHFARHKLSEESARLSLVLACLWPYLVVYAHKPFTEFVATGLFFGALGLVCRHGRDGKASGFAFGAILALVGLVRMQYLPLAGMLWLATIITAKRRWTAATVIGGMVAIFLVATLETITWGTPIHSYYANFMFNQEFDKYREAQEIHFYLPRLLVATAGGALVALYAFVKDLKRHVLLAFLIVITLTLHMYQAHKEFRFVFVILPMFLIVMGDQMTMWSKNWTKIVNFKSTTFVAALFLVVIAGNVVDDRWMHQAASRERGDVRYLFGQSNLFEVYLTLAKRDEVKGVVHVGEPYFNTPGYYYLHHDVPFYDGFSLEWAQSDTKSDLSDLVSHVVSKRPLPNIPGSIKIFDDEGEYAYAYIEDVMDVRAWLEHTPTIVGEGLAAFARHLGFSGFGHPTIIEFAGKK